MCGVRLLPVLPEGHPANVLLLECPDAAPLGSFLSCVLCSEHWPWPYIEPRCPQTLVLPDSSRVLMLPRCHSAPHTLGICIPNQQLLPSRPGQSIKERKTQEKLRQPPGPASVLL